MKEILDLLQTTSFWKSTETIQIAKGKYKYPYSWKELGNVLRRGWYGR
jgi:hypothetical protein